MDLHAEHSVHQTCMRPNLIFRLQTNLCMRLWGDDYCFPFPVSITVLARFLRRNDPAKTPPMSSL